MSVRLPRLDAARIAPRWTAIQRLALAALRTSPSRPADAPSSTPARDWQVAPGRWPPHDGDRRR
jgi:hypothetical protein